MTISPLVGSIRPRALALLAVALLVAACSSSGGNSGSNPTTTQATQGSAAQASSATTIGVSGGHLVDGSGRTVYLWVADKNGSSNCTGACASVWPPVPGPGTPSATAHLTGGQLATVTRSDGHPQLTYAGHPLYYYAADKGAGQTAGQGSDGFGAKWWEVDAAGRAITTDGSAGQSPSAPVSATSSASNGYNY